MTTELFTALIKNGMENCGLSLREVARGIEVDPSFLSKVLSGKRSAPSDEKTLRKLAEVLELDPIRLIVSTGTIPSNWQSTFESQDFLDELTSYLKEGRHSRPSRHSSPARHSGESRNLVNDTTRLDSGPGFRRGKLMCRNDDRGAHKSKELSEDLL